MIKNNQSIDGTTVEDLPFNSRKIVIRICDRCGQESEAKWNDIIRCRKKHNIILDYCFPCAMRIYNTGDKNPAKRKDVKEKISKASKGKSKSFKDGKNLRILDRRISSSGHILKWLPAENKHIQEHRIVLAEHLNKHHSELDEVHHINGVKTDNQLNNLIELTRSEHGKLHSQLEKIAFDLVSKKFIVFNKDIKEYRLSPQIEIQLMEQSLGFEDVAIKQKKNICMSRLDANIESEIVKGVFRPVPLIAANMSTVCNSNFCIDLFKLGALGIMHRADTKENIIKAVIEIANECEWVAASIGIEKDQLDFANELIKNGCNIITIDVAHGYSDVVLNLAKEIKYNNPNIKIIIGNTTNTELLEESYDFVDAIKVGIAQGFACETKNTAGCTEKQFSAVLKFKHLSKNFGIPVISDGGIREPADFTKAIGAGANSVMAGKIFAMCPESAAEIIEINGVSKKVYAGMASRYVQEKWKGKLKEGTCPEGGIRMLDVGESLENLLNRYSGALKSGITYAGANDINSFQKNVEFVRIN